MRTVDGILAELRAVLEEEIRTELMGRLAGGMPRVMPKPKQRSPAFVAAVASLRGPKATKPTASKPKNWPNARGRDQSEIEALRKKSLEFIKDHPNCNRAQIAQFLGVHPNEAAFPIRKLKEAGEIKTKGERAKTTYSAAK